jgi:cytidylate kinase
MNYFPVITIDGSSGTGKGTVARRLAAHYGFDCLDTGILYRATAAQALAQGVLLTDEGACTKLAQTLSPQDLIPTPSLREESIGQAASRISVYASLREALFQRQRDFALTPPSGRGAVLDGRDVGTVIFPEALCKIFLTAQLEARAARRFQELQTQAGAPSYEEVYREMAERDERDSWRAIAPLKPAPDAYILDTSQLTADDVFSLCVAYCDQTLCASHPSVLAVSG